MEKIVEGLKSVQPQARIFVLTRPRETSRKDYSYDEWNDVVRNIALVGTPYRAEPW